MRFRFGINDSDDAPSGGATPPPTGDDPAADPAEPNPLQSRVTELETELAEKQAAVDSAMRLDKKLAVIRDNDKEGWDYISAKMRGEPVSPPAAAAPATPDAPALDLSHMDDATRQLIEAQQSQIEQLVNTVEGTQAHIAALNQRNAEGDFDSSMAQARQEMGDDVVNELLPLAVKMVKESPGLSKIPDAVVTILKALDHDKVADRTIASRAAAEKAKNEKLARTRGFGKRGLGIESKPGAKPKRQRGDALNSAIDAVLNGEAR